MLRLTRTQAKQLQSEYPLGEAYAGVAYGDKKDPVSAGIVGGGALLGGVLQAGAAGRAADKAAGAQRYASDLQAQIAREQMEAQRPWREVGERALPQLEAYDQTRPLSALMQDWQADPGYQFRLNQGLLGVQGSQAARGTLRSGNTLKALMDYGQNTAAGEYQNIYNRRLNENTLGFNRLASLAGIGQTATNQGSQVQQNLGNTLSNLAMQNAATQGQAGIAQANAWGGALGGAANALGQYYATQNSPWMQRGFMSGGSADPGSAGFFGPPAA